MTLSVKIPIPGDCSLRELDEVVEMLRGHGYPEVDFDRRVVAFRWEPSDSEPSDISTLMVQAAMAKLHELLKAQGGELDPLGEDGIEQVLAWAIGVGERWAEVVDELRSHGWHEIPEPVA